MQAKAGLLLPACLRLTHAPPGTSLLGARQPYWKMKSIYGEGEKTELKSLSRVRLFAIPWTVAYQAPQSMEFSRQEYWSGLLFPSPGNLPNPGIKPRSPTLQTDTLLSEPPGKERTYPHLFKWAETSAQPGGRQGRVLVCHWEPVKG